MLHRCHTHPARLPLLALILLLTPLVAVVRPQPVAAAGVVSECTEAALRSALEGGGLVTFSCSGTIPIAGQLVIEADTAIDGGRQVTLDGGGVTRLIQVNGGVELELLGLTLIGGAAPPGLDGGGAVLNFGTLAVVASTLSGNLATWGGAIDNYGALTLTSSTLSGNRAVDGGGAIYINSGNTATITAGMLSGNSAGVDGGAIINDNGSLTIVAGTLTGNRAVGEGGAIRNGGVLTIESSTLAGNTAFSGGAISITPNDTAILTASTLSDNSATLGGTVYNFLGAVRLTANILRGSNVCGGPRAITSNGYNVASDATCNLTSTGDLQSTDPLLGSLQNNGGPTLTMLPQPGSPAIDRVPNALCTTLSAANDGRDQRGAPRPEGNLPCDSGSVEVQVNTYFCVGDRSGALRYFVTADNCVRGEHRLMPATNGLYAFCVGDRSGSMRYLPSSGAGCARGEWQLTLPVDGPITICVGERSHAVRYVADAGQCNPRGELVYVVIDLAV